MAAATGDVASVLVSTFEALPKGSVVSEVARRMIERFLSGDIAPGTRLPPERALAATLGVGRSAVREALAALELLGIVDVRPGSGTYLRGAEDEAITNTLGWELMLGRRRAQHLVEARNQLEIQTARFAAARASAEEVEVLRGHLDAMTEHRGDRQRFIDADQRFHHQVGLSARNPVLADLLQSLRALIRVWVDHADHSAEEIRSAIVEHRAILGAIAANDEDAAEASMREHMDTAERRLMRSRRYERDAGGAAAPVA